MFIENKIGRLIAVVISLAVLALITAIAKNVAGITAITVALVYLLVVLTVAGFAGRAAGLIIAVTSGLLVNFFFLPPFGTLYIQNPEDWVSFAVYTVTALVLSNFATTVRWRAVEADHFQAQLANLARFTDVLAMARPKELTLEFLAGELQKAFKLKTCVLYLFDGTGAQSSQSLPSAGKSAKLPNTYLEVITQVEAGVRCMPLKDQDKTIGAMVLGQAVLAHEVMETVAATLSLAVRQHASAKPVG